MIKNPGKYQPSSKEKYASKGKVYYAPSNYGTLEDFIGQNINIVFEDIHIEWDYGDSFSHKNIYNYEMVLKQILEKSIFGHLLNVDCESDYLKEEIGKDVEVYFETFTPDQDGGDGGGSRKILRVKSGEDIIYEINAKGSE